MHISNNFSVKAIKPEHEFLYELSKKLVLQKEESELFENKTSDLLSSFNYRAGTNEIELYVQTKSEQKKQDNDIKVELKKRLNSDVQKAFEILQNYLDKQNI